MDRDNIPFSATNILIREASSSWNFSLPLLLSFTVEQFCRNKRRRFLGLPGNIPDRYGRAYRVQSGRVPARACPITLNGGIFKLVHWRRRWQGVMHRSREAFEGVSFETSAMRRDKFFFFGLVRLFVFRSMIKSRSITMGTKLVRNDSIESASKGWIIRRVCVNGIWNLWNFQLGR